MLPSTSRPSSSDEQRLDDEVASFLQGSEPFHTSLKKLSLSTQVNENPTTPECSSQPTVVDQTCMVENDNISPSSANSPSDFMSLSDAESRTGIPSSDTSTKDYSLLKQSEFDCQVDNPFFKHQSHDEASSAVPDEVLVVVVGPKGSGKSAFLSSVMETQHKTDEAIKSSLDVKSYHTTHLGNAFHLLETPGFENELEIEVVTRRILLWLEDYYTSGKDPANTTILYLHPIGEPRLYGSIRRSLEAFTSLVGPDVWPRVVLGTTGWTAAERQTPGLAEKRESELLSSSKFWKDMQSHGAGIMRIPEQNIFAKDVLERLRERISSKQGLQRQDLMPPAVINDRSSMLQRKADYLEYERRLLEMVGQIRGGDHRLRISPPSSAFQLICNECRGNCGVGDVYQCQECYRDTSQESFILCSDCYQHGKSCDQPEHRQRMQKKKVKDVSCESHAKTAFQGWDFIPCSCCEGYCDIVFLHCCDCLQDSFNMCLACMKEGAKCSSESHALHIVCWWKGKGGLDSETPPPLSSYLRSKRDDLIEDVGEAQGVKMRGSGTNPDLATIGPKIRNALGKATADFIRTVFDND
ncbi:hypothetical protein F4678DRAFT_325781 [Xylaria arbuscula]|nr:hypothetical protein F4678DRAFT_325781 [Xylaria arbuscula]